MPKAVGQECPPQEVGDILVRVAQVYLRRRLQAVAPGAILTLYWEDFYRVYGPMVVATVRHYVADRDDADDLVQEIWLTVSRRLPQFEWRDSRGGFRAWMSKLVRDKTVDLIRRRLRQLSVTTADKALDELLERGDQELEAQLSREAVRAAVEELRPQIGELNYAILHAHYWQQQTAPAIARTLGLTVHQARCRLHRVLAKLRRRLGAYFDTPQVEEVT